jgi:hypothetical protein
MTGEESMTGEQLVKMFADHAPKNWATNEVALWEKCTQEEKEWYNTVAAKLELKKEQDE